MAKETLELKTFNRGLISPLALARTDLERTAFSAETYTNWMPRDLGSMMLRAGKKYIGNTRSDLAAKFIPFIFSASDTALLELTATTLRVWVSDALVTRAAVTSAVTNGTFDSNITSWTDKSAGTGASIWVTGGYLGLTGDGTNEGASEQEITTVETSTEHALDIVIQRGPVLLRVGSTTGDDDYITETTLGTGSHSLTFTPTGNFFIRFLSRHKRQVLIDSCDVGSSGVMTVTAPWAAADLSRIRYDQSADVVYVPCAKTTDSIGYQQYKIERRSTTSWSVVKYEVEDGPFKSINLGPITIATDALSGNVTLTASQNLFKSTDVGGLYKIASSGQTVTASVSAQNTFTGTIKVTGVTTQRIFTLTISGRVDSTITLQRSLTSDAGPWEDTSPQYTADTTISFDDTLDNQIAWYQIGIKTGEYGTDTVVLTLDYPIGSIEGVARITAYSSATSVSAEVITDFGGTTATADWYQGEWSDRNGWPTAVALVEGRLGWSGRSKAWVSVSDAYESFDDDVAGDSGTITRTIGSGPVDNINWMISADRLMLGAETTEWTLRASSDDEILTPSNANFKSFSTQGSSTTIAVKMDDSVIFIQRGGARVYEAAMGPTYRLQSNDLTSFYPEAGSSQITHIAIQRQPDTRIHCMRADGSVLIFLYDKYEEVACWVKHTGGTVEDIVVLPGAAGTGEDAVYYVVNRTINSATVRFLERWSLESECQGGTTSKQLDAHVTGTVTGGIMSGLTHLEGETVTAWVNGKDAGTGTVASGSVSGLTSDGSGVVGIAYTAQFKSAKLSELTQKKNITRLGVILYNTHYQGLQYGPDFTTMDNLPLMKDESLIADDTVHSTFDEESFNFPGEWSADSRLHLQAASPKPCTLLAAVIGLER